MPLRFEKISYAYGSRNVIRGLSFDLEDTEWLAIVGANGSGRSTLAEVAAGLRRPQRGRVLFDGQDMWHRSGKHLKRRLGLVMQRAEDQFLGDTVYTDIAFGPAQTSHDRDHIVRAVRRALHSVGFDLDEVSARSPLEFSGGQRRRLAVAGLLALEPSILILDEPFAGLDARARNDMVDLLKRLREHQGVTILTMTSDFELLDAASRLALLVHGEIGLVGDLRDFVANQRLCREAGISLPETVQLALELRERGWSVPVFGSEGSLEAAIAGEWRQRKGA